MRRFPRAADHFEALEPRQLQSHAHAADAAPAAPAPGDGNDYVMLAGDSGVTATHAMPEQVKRSPLPGGFTWFDATPQEQLNGFVPGVAPVFVDDRGMFARDANGNVEGDVIDEANTRNLAHTAMRHGGILAIDIENWSMDVSSADQSTVNRNVSRFAQVITWLRDEAPTLKIGLYGVLPTTQFWQSELMGWAEDTYAADNTASWNMWYVADASAAHAKWQASCNFIQALADKVDYLFPSLYTFYSDRDQWTRVAKSVIDEARTYGKPVVPFLWPQYHDAGPLANVQIEDDFWKLELNVVQQYADGAAIWDYQAYSADDSWVKSLNALRTVSTLAPQHVVNTTIAAAATTDTFGDLQIKRDDDASTSSRAVDLLAA